MMTMIIRIMRIFKIITIIRAIRVTSARNFKLTLRITIIALRIALIPIRNK